MSEPRFNYSSSRTPGHVNISCPVPRDTHGKLKRLAEERQMPLGVLSVELLKWAGEKSGTELARLGVRIPIWPHELGDVTAGVAPVEPNTNSKG